MLGEVLGGALGEALGVALCGVLGGELYSLKITLQMYECFVTF